MGETAHSVELVLPSGRTVCLTVGSEEHILDAAEEQGIVLPSLCRQGWCCTCAVRVLEGVVDQSDSRRFYDADRRAGFALICTGKPRSDLKLKTHALPEMRAHRISLGLPVPRGTTLPDM
jgi:ferredoxin